MAIKQYQHYILIRALIFVRPKAVTVLKNALYSPLIVDVNHFEYLLLNKIMWPKI